MSIKPKYWELIKSGKKRWEFRKFDNFAAQPFDTVVFYASAPIGRIVGFAQALYTTAGYLSDLWDETHHESGISVYDFEDYYTGRDKGVAIRLGSVLEFSANLFWDHPPMSWQYMPDDLWSVLFHARSELVYSDS